MKICSAILEFLHADTRTDRCKEGNRSILATLIVNAPEVINNYTLFSVVQTASHLGPHMYTCGVRQVRVFSVLPPRLYAK